MSQVHQLQRKLLASAALAEPAHAPFTCAPVQRDTGDVRHDERRRTHQTALASWLYILRIEGNDDLGPLPPAYLVKLPDLVASGRFRPTARFPAAYRDGPAVWATADAATRADEDDKTSAIHIILTMPRGKRADWVRLIRAYAQRAFASEGMIVDWALHHRVDADGTALVHGHGHLLVAVRRYRSGYGHGARHPRWLATKTQIQKAEDIWLEMSGLAPKTFTTAA